MHLIMTLHLLNRKVVRRTLASCVRQHQYQWPLSLLCNSCGGSCLLRIRSACVHVWVQWLCLRACQSHAGLATNLPQGLIAPATCVHVSGLEAVEHVQKR